MSNYEKLKQYIIYMRMMQEAKLDVLSVTSSRKGFGKSSTNLWVAKLYIDMFGLLCKDCGHEYVYQGNAIIPGKYGEAKVKEDLSEPCPKCKSENITKPKKFNFMKYLAYDNDEVYDKIHTLDPYSPLLGDEAVRWMMGEDWNTYESKEMKKLIAQARTKRLMMLVNIPKFKWVDGKYREDMATFWLRILKRGIIVLLQPDLGEVEDTWHMKEFNEILGSYFYFTPEEEIVKKAERLIAKHPCAFDWFKVPELPDEIYAEYLIARDKKAFERKRITDKIDQKDLAKIAAWNIMTKWPEIMGAVKNSKMDRPTLKMMEEFVFVDPKTEKPVVAYTTVRNWQKEIEQVMNK